PAVVPGTRSAAPHPSRHRTPTDGRSRRDDKRGRARTPERTGPASARRSGSEGRWARPMVVVLVALMRRPDVREDRQECAVVLVDAVTQHVVGRPVRDAEYRIQGRAIALSQSAELDIRHVVEQTAAVREAAQVAIEGAQTT